MIAINSEYVDCFLRLAMECVVDLRVVVFVVVFVVVLLLEVD